MGVQAAALDVTRAHEEHLKHVTDTITQDAARATQLAVRRAVQESEARALSAQEAAVKTATKQLRAEVDAYREALVRHEVPLPTLTSQNLCRTQQPANTP